ncbi:cytosolic carboxypeptidase 6, partial [Triplophysa rosa]
EENSREHLDTDNEAGGEDALVGNVNKLMVTPSGYSGPPRKGHLIFDACFESAKQHCSEMMLTTCTLTKGKWRFLGNTVAFDVSDFESRSPRVN